VRRIPVLVAAALLGGSEVRAEGIPQLFVVWEAPAGCPDHDGFVAMVGDALHGEAPSAPMHVEVVVEPAGRELALTLRTRSGDADGERVLRGRDCRVLAETAALTLALAIAPDAVRAAGPPPPGRDSEDPPGARPTGRPVATTVRAEQGREWGIPLAVRVGAAGELGGLPGLSAGVAAAIGTRIGRRWRIEATGAYWFEKSAVATDDPAATADVNALGAGLRVCFDWLERRSVQAGPCVGGDLVRTRGTGTSGLSPTSGTWLRPLVTAGPSLAWAVSDQLEFRVDIDLVLRPWLRPFTDAGGTIVIYEARRWGSRAGLALEAHFR